MQVGTATGGEFGVLGPRCQTDLQKARFRP